ncbi:MAG: hypothetical protein ABI857_08655 [Acidobacteriota bacterium]
MKNRVARVNVKYGTLVGVWGALLASQAVFLLIVYAARPELFNFDLSEPLLGKYPIITVLFAIAAVVVFILSFLLRNQHIRRSVVDQNAGCVQTALVLGGALSEISSVLGLVLAFVFDYHYFFLWIALGLVGVLSHFPRRGNLLAAGYKNV